MDYFVEQGANDQEVQTIIRRKYGERARILSRKEVRSGGVLGLFRRRAVEVTGYCSHAPQPQRSASRGSMHEERQKILDTVRPPLHQQTSPPVAAQTPASEREQTAPDRGEPSRRVNSDSSNSPSLDAVLTEIRSLRDRMDTSAPSGSEPAGIQRTREILEDNDFSNGYIREIIARLRTDCTMDELDDGEGIMNLVGDWIEQSIRIYPWQERRKRPHVFVL
ncbi:MAG TPA: hypothetical protein VJ932_10905, partial [Alkalispirochaeta sp.]|nr:hypothetical protein [Alkalispirochaeta sp.]